MWTASFHLNTPSGSSLHFNYQQLLNSPNYFPFPLQPPPSTMAAAVTGCRFSTTSIHSLNSARSKSLLSSSSSSSDHSLKFTPTRISHLTSISKCTELVPISGPASHKWPRISRLSASVAQEEAALTAETAAEEVVEVEGDQEAASGGDGEEISAPIVHTKLYFGNVPYHVDSAKLAAIVQNYATPELVEVLYDNQTGRSRGYGFVTMSSIEDCEKVIQNLDNMEYLGRVLRVNFSDKPRPKIPLYRETDYKLFVGNLSWSTTSERLTEVFQEFGEVVSTRVIYDGETGNSRGYGFVCFSSQSELDKVLENETMDVDGRTIRLSVAGGGRK